MKKKVFILCWIYNHKNEIENGANVFTDKDKAVKALKRYYEQAILNITPNNKVEELSINDYDFSAENAYYDIERYEADSWEKGWIDENEIEF